LAEWREERPARHVCAGLRRLDEKAEIIMVERGPYVSYANCGLPYRVGGVIERDESLFVANEQLFRNTFAIDARTNCEAVGISPKEKTVTLRDVKTGKESTESYDKLVLSPGAASVRPPLPGIDLPGIFHVRTVPDALQIREWLEKGSPFLACRTPCKSGSGWKRAARFSPACTGMRDSRP
jgi:NADPH-dependent 2,4-dienoyl-CoA reductase/sulfur reductase-like enzyme